MDRNNPDWWRGAVIYEIYPRSYFDTSGDGVGDLPGIIHKMDYIADLGVDGIWICPFFKSPMDDFGYDVSDYRKVDPLFGTTEDFFKLLEAAHKHGLKVIIDMVLNHTSDEHPWFHESRRDRDNSKADWYIWQDPNPDGTVPTNWLSRFGGPAWTFEPRRKQYYFHSFLSSQPDLNIWNPVVQDAILAELEYWLEKGVDGVRLDACNHYLQDKEFRDNPPGKKEHRGEPYMMQAHVYDRTRPENINVIRRIRDVMDRYPGTFVVGEIGDDNGLKVSAEYVSGTDKLHTAYCFDMLMAAEYEPDTFRQPVEAFGRFSHDGWPSWAFSNHDAVRPATRWGGKYANDPAFIRQELTLLFSLRGTAFLYQGEELGLTEADIPFRRIQDPWGKMLFPVSKGRDGCRTPMPWVEEPVTAGFTSGNPWLPIPDEHLGLSVELQEQDCNSPLCYSRRFLRWRKSCLPMIKGNIEFNDQAPEPFLVFKRTGAEGTIWMGFNLSEEEQQLPEGLVPDSDSCDAIVPESQRPIRQKDGKLAFPSWGIHIGLLRAESKNK